MRHAVVTLLMCELQLTIIRRLFVIVENRCFAANAGANIRVQIHQTCHPLSHPLNCLSAITCINTFGTRAARIVFLSAVFVCVSVCLSVNAITPEPLEISSRNFQGTILWSKIEMADKVRKLLYWSSQEVI